MSRGTSTRKLLREDVVSAALAGDPATLASLAKKGGNSIPTLAPAPEEAMLAEQLGVPIDKVREAHANFLKQEAAKKDKAPAGEKKKEEKPWYMKEGSGPRRLIFGSGHGGNTNEGVPLPAGAEFDSMVDLIRKKGILKPGQKPGQPAPQQAPTPPPATPSGR
jgi:hypothetical protein